MIITAREPKRRLLQFTLRTLLVGVTLLMVAYLGSFYLLRRDLSVTFLVSRAPASPMGPAGHYSVRVFYFSQNSQLNYAAFLFYYPLHRQSADSLKLFEEALTLADKDEELVRQKLRYFYVSDVAILYRAQVAGFDREEQRK